MTIYSPVTSYQLPINQSTKIMQNKPNWLDAQMNASCCFTTNYEQITMNNANKNKPKSNPTCSELVEPISKGTLAQGRQARDRGLSIILAEVLRNSCIFCDFPRYLILWLWLYGLPLLNTATRGKWKAN